MDFKLIFFVYSYSSADQNASVTLTVQDQQPSSIVAVNLPPASSSSLGGGGGGGGSSGGSLGGSSSGSLGGALTVDGGGGGCHTPPTTPVRAPNEQRPASTLPIQQVRSYSKKVTRLLS